MESLAKMMHLFPGGQHPVEVMVIDYVRCFELQESPEAKVLMEAISLAVEHGKAVTYEQHLYAVLYRFVFIQCCMYMTFHKRYVRSRGTAHTCTFT